MKSRICFVIPQFGLIPGYIDYFILTGAHLSERMDFRFFTDQDIQIDRRVKNVFITKMSLEEFNSLASRKLDHSFVISRTYKLCDLKPMYGLIFEDYLKKYDYWSHGDFDMIFGDLEKLLRSQQFESYDIFGVQRIYSSGPFQIFRNTPRVNHFFEQSESWRKVLDESGYLGFDEAGDVIRELWKGRDIRECRGEIQSMTHLMKDEKLIQRLGIRISMQELITEAFPERNIIRFNNGKLTLEPDGLELYIYHFMNRKNRLLFNDVLLNPATVTFEFSKYGFRRNNPLEFFGGLIWSLVKRYWIRIRRKIASK